MLEVLWNEISFLIGLFATEKLWNTHTEYRPEMESVCLYLLPFLSKTAKQIMIELSVLKSFHSCTIIYFWWNLQLKSKWAFSKHTIFFFPRNVYLKRFYLYAPLKPINVLITPSRWHEMIRAKTRWRMLNSD